jgi:hypothetical protein
MVPMLHIMVLNSLTYDGTCHFYLLFKLVYIKNQIIPISHWIVPTSHMIVLISHLMVPIEWVPYLQKECEYCRMTLCT